MPAGGALAVGLKEFPPDGDRFFSVGCGCVEAGAEELGVGVGSGSVRELQPAIVVATTATHPAAAANFRAKCAEEPIAVPSCGG